MTTSKEQTTHLGGENDSASSEVCSFPRRCFLMTTSKEQTTHLGGENDYASFKVRSSLKVFP